jgi:hypothetical protein
LLVRSAIAGPQVQLGAFGRVERGVVEATQASTVSSLELASVLMFMIV